MSIAFYMDENVHRGITDGLRIRDVDVLTVQKGGYIETFCIIDSRAWR